MNPEDIARENIDKQLESLGWVVQDKDKIDLGKQSAVVVREFQTESGEADYIVFLNRKPIGVIEAKKEGLPLTPVEVQSNRYAKSKLKYFDNAQIRFIYESTGIETRFTDLRDPEPRSREIFTFHRPETLLQYLVETETIRARLHKLPPFTNEEGRFRACQEIAIQNLEKSFKNNRPKALIQMATGSGKTFTAITSIYRLLKHANAKRILFLVDTKNLGEQAEQEFQGYVPTDDQRRFIELYSVQRLKSKFIDKSSHVCISTIQRLYSILRGEDLDESLEETSLYELKGQDQVKSITYNPEVPIDAFDFIVIDECHRSIYNVWKQVLDYFDAFLIGLTATPDNRTFGFFHQNVVSEYCYEDAVRDGVNVPYEVYTIETEITKNGSQIKAKEYVDKRCKLTRKKRWEQLDEDINYSNTQLDRDFVNPSQIRSIIREVKNKMPEIFPGRNEVPKTLIFAKTDNHADDIIQIIREEFNQGNDFCKKVTYGLKDEKPSDVLQQFRNDYNPRVAVTVDMIATGTDVKSIECLLFMRDVRSKNYYEQMKGRGTRTLDKDSLQRVTPSSKSNKTHFVIIDAVGVEKSIKTSSRPLERKKGVAFKNLMMAVAMGQRDEDTLTSLANRLSKIERQVEPFEREKIIDASGGLTINQMIGNLLDCYDEDKITDKAQQAYSVDEPAPAQLQAVQEEIINQACRVFDNPEFRETIEKIRNDHEQTIDIVNIDAVTFSGFDKAAQEKAKQAVEDFEQFINKNKDEIIALQIFFDQPYRRRELTYKMIKDLKENLLLNKPPLAIERIWTAYENLENKRIMRPETDLTALVALVRRAIGIDSQLVPYEATVNKNFKDWIFKRHASHKAFTDEQLEWLRMIKDYIVTSFHCSKEDFDLSPFGNRGGLMKAWSLFGEELKPLLDEINSELAA